MITPLSRKRQQEQGVIKVGTPFIQRAALRYQKVMKSFICARSQGPSSPLHSLSLSPDSGESNSPKKYGQFYCIARQGRDWLSRWFRDRLRCEFSSN